MVTVFPFCPNISAPTLPCPPRSPGLCCPRVSFQYPGALLASPRSRFGQVVSSSLLFLSAYLSSVTLELHLNVCYRHAWSCQISSLWPRRLFWLLRRCCCPASRRTRNYSELCLQIVQVNYYLQIIKLIQVLQKHLRLVMNKRTRWSLTEPKNFIT